MRFRVRWVLPVRAAQYLVGDRMGSGRPGVLVVRHTSLCAGGIGHEMQEAPRVARGVSLLVRPPLESAGDAVSQAPAQAADSGFVVTGCQMNRMDVNFPLPGQLPERIRRKTRSLLKKRSSLRPTSVRKSFQSEIQRDGRAKPVQIRRIAAAGSALAALMRTAPAVWVCGGG